MGDELWQRSAVEQVRMVKTKRVSARELLASHLDRIDEVNPTLRAVVGMDSSVAQSEAAAVDNAIAAGRRVGPLAGLVTAHKDLVDTAKFVTTYGSKVFADHRPTTDDPMVARIRTAGAVAVGKTNVPEFGLGSHTYNEVYGPTVNPFDTTRSAGGSSGGAAVAVRTGMVAIADGSDLGGSLRNPAAWNNVVGFRGSPRVVPRRGGTNAWNPIAITGPIARSVDDLVLALRVMTQADPLDPLYRPIGLPPLFAPPDRPVRVAWSSDLGGLPIETAVSAQLEGLRTDLQMLGWEVSEDEPDFSGADECFVTLRASWVTNEIGRVYPELAEMKATAHEEISRGRSLSALDVAAAFGHLNVLWQRAVSFFEEYDVMIAPVTQVMPFSANQEYPTEIDGQAMGSYIDWMRSCTRVTALGCPAVSLPAGFDGVSGLPVGVQLIGRPSGDVQLLRIAKALEALSGHGRRWPDR